MSGQSGARRATCGGGRGVRQTWQTCRRQPVRQPVLSLSRVFSIALSFQKRLLRKPERVLRPVHRRAQPAGDRGHTAVDIAPTLPLPSLHRFLHPRHGGASAPSSGHELAPPSVTLLVMARKKPHVDGQQVCGCFFVLCVCLLVSVLLCAMKAVLANAWAVPMPEKTLLAPSYRKK